MQAPTLSCDSWAAQESKQDLSKCISEAGKWYGCPRQIDTGRWWRNDNFPDEDFAREEVRAGMAGWKYDICCSDDSLTRERLESSNFCGQTSCEFNSGAEFCIRSPRLACLEQNSKSKVLYVSNQCCYNTAGNLIQPGEAGAGRLNLQENSVKNMVAHYWSDLLPYKVCCADASSSDCETYKTYRPTIIGGYWPRNILIGRGDPDFQTVDGLSYPFNGLGVYVMLTTSMEEPTNVHISTRRVGLGSVFSGFAAQYKSSKLQGYINENGTFYLKINNREISREDPSEFTLDNITMSVSDDRSTFTFEFDETSLIIRVVINLEGINALNLMFSVPPTFKWRADGLLGHYDGESWNDFTTSG